MSNSNDIPVSTIPSQPLVNTPTHSDTTIMDDTVMTMNGLALMGGPVTSIENVRSVIENPLQHTVIPRTS